MSRLFSSLVTWASQETPTCATPRSCKLGPMKSFSQVIFSCLLVIFIINTMGWSGNTKKWGWKSQQSWSSSESSSSDKRATEELQSQARAETTGSRGSRAMRNNRRRESSREGREPRMKKASCKEPGKKTWGPWAKSCNSSRYHLLLCAALTAATHCWWLETKDYHSCKVLGPL
jgi:hypothetical protein